MTPADRDLFAQHAPLSAIRARMDQAYAKQHEAQKEIKWLTSLLISRGQQFRAGMQQAAETTTPDSTERPPRWR